MPHLHGLISVRLISFLHQCEYYRIFLFNHKMTPKLSILPFHCSLYTTEVMGKSSEDQLSSDGEMQGQPQEACIIFRKRASHEEQTGCGGAGKGK